MSSVSLEHIHQLTMGLVQFIGLLSLFSYQLGEVIIAMDIELDQIALIVLLYGLSNLGNLYGSPLILSNALNVKGTIQDTSNLKLSL